MHSKLRIFIVAVLIAFTAFGVCSKLIYAASVDELQDKIRDHSETIRNLEKEIAKVQSQVEDTQKQANTLTNTIKTLDLSRKKLLAQIDLTNNKIERTNLEIRQLQSSIGDKEERISYNRGIIAQTLSKIDQQESQSLVAALLAYDNLSTFWNEVDTMTRFQSQVKTKTDELKQVKAGLVVDKTATEKKKSELIDLKSDLSGQKQSVEETSKEQQQLLSDTKNLESNYRKILADKKAKKDAFEKELFQYESQLRIAIDPASIPATGKGVIAWPLDHVVITQYFGNTEFATKNAQIYNGRGHSGIDLGTSIGTRVKAADAGIVMGTGNTDVVPGCYSYGKWVFIKHANGLGTLYAHLSYIGVSQGDAVSRGQQIGLSGNTGYSTGPHLHFGVYAVQGVRIQKFESSINCRNVLIPLADPKAYLNPLSYL